MGEIERLRASASELRPVVLEARSVLDEHGFSDGALLAEWAGRLDPALAPPRIVCRRALFVLAASRLWRPTMFAGASIHLRYDDDLPNPVVSHAFPEPFRNPAALDAITVEVPAADVAEALVLEAEVLLPHDEDVVDAEVVDAQAPDGGSRLVLRLRRADDRPVSGPRTDVLAWALGLGRPTIEDRSPDLVEMAFPGPDDRLHEALATVGDWVSRRSVRAELHAHLDRTDRLAPPAVPGWETFVAALDAAGLVAEYDDRQEDPEGERAGLRRIDLGEPLAHRWLSWEAPYDEQPTAWVEDALPTTQARLIRTLEWAQAHPDRWTPRFVQAPVIARAPSVTWWSW